MNHEVATFGGGCFWCLDSAFRSVKGVLSVNSGYAGGDAINANYKAVCSGDTRHAEVVQIEFDPNTISFKQLLLLFFSLHDPTTLNRQGADIGTQYRSVIFYHTPLQKEHAEATIIDLNNQKIWHNLIVTEVSPFITFYDAEQYHQDYYKNNPMEAYCRAVIEPKLKKFIKENKFFIE